MARMGSKHVLYYAPECEFCQSLIENLQQTRAVYDFNAFDVTIGTPPDYVTHVPTIVVLGTVMVGKDAFEWVERLKYNGQTNPATGTKPGDEEGFVSPMVTDPSIETAADFDPRVSEPILLHASEPNLMADRSRISDEKIKEGTLDLEALAQQRKQEIMMIMPQQPVV